MFQFVFGALKTLEHVSIFVHNSTLATWELPDYDGLNELDGSPWSNAMKVQISVRGRKYTVRSDEEDVDLVEIAKYVDGKMLEISQRSGTFDEYTIAMLAALNIASEFERFKKEVDEELQNIDRELASTTVLLEANLPSDGTEA